MLARERDNAAIPKGTRTFGQANCGNWEASSNNDLDTCGIQIVIGERLKSRHDAGCVLIEAAGFIHAISQLYYCQAVLREHNQTRTNVVALIPVEVAFDFVKRAPSLRFRNQRRSGPAILQQN